MAKIFHFRKDGTASLWTCREQCMGTVSWWTLRPNFVEQSLKYFAQYLSVKYLNVSF